MIFRVVHERWSAGDVDPCWRGRWHDDLLDALARADRWRDDRKLLKQWIETDDGQRLELPNPSCGRGP